MTVKKFDNLSIVQEGWLILGTYIELENGSFEACVGKHTVIASSESQAIRIIKMFNEYKSLKAA